MFTSSGYIKELISLGSDKAVELFRQLLWAEAGAIGLGRNLVNVPGCINVGDGGIDAYIENNITGATSSVIPIGITGYQIKSSDLNPQSCRNELHEDDDVHKPIKKEIKKILDKNGTYCLVLFKDLTVPKYKRRLDAIKAEIKSKGYKKAKVVLFTASQIEGFLHSHYSLLAQIRPELTKAISHKSWKLNDPKTFVPDDQRKSSINRIRGGLRAQSGHTLIYRVDGLPGIGKTRFVYELLNTPDLANQTIYFRSADTFLSKGICELIINNPVVKGIFVIDECSLEEHKKICEALDRSGGRISIFTLSYQGGRVPEDRTSLRPLNAIQIEEILKADYAKMPQEVISKIARFSSGYPRISDRLAKSFERDGDLTCSDDELFKRLIAGDYDPDQTESVLIAYALFEKVGYGNDVVQESKFVAKYFNIPWDVFQKIVREQRYRGILQGNHFLYLTPYILRIHLVRRWWEIKNWSVDEFFNLDKKMQGEKLRGLSKALLDHLKYIGHNDQGKALVKEILSSAPYNTISDFDKKSKADFFLSLSEANPEYALRCLEDAFLQAPQEQLLRFDVGRRQVIYVLNSIAIWSNLFERAANIFIRLACAENEKWANNATGDFGDLFLVYAPIEASTKVRSQYLVRQLQDESPDVRKIAIHACGRALKTDHFVIRNSKYDHGLEKLPKSGVPETWGELFDYYRTVWSGLIEVVRSDPLNREQALSVLLEHAGPLSQLHNISEMILETFEGFLDLDYIDKRKIVRLARDILGYDKKNIPKKLWSRWKKLQECLNTGSYGSLLRRYVGMYLLEDSELDRKGNIRDLNLPHIKKIAARSLKNPDELKSELAWLNSTDAVGAYQLGYEVGVIDVSRSLYEAIYNSQNGSDPKYSASFLSGYLRSLYETDLKVLNVKINQIYNNESLIQHFSEIVWRSGLTQDSFLKVVDLVKGKRVPVTHLEVFRFGGTIKEVNEKTFHDLIIYLANEKDVLCAEVALELITFYYSLGPNKERALQKDITLVALTAKSLLANPPDRLRSPQSADYNWARIAEHYIGPYPENVPVLARHVLTAYCKGSTIFDDRHGQVYNIVCKLASQDPLSAWEIISPHLGPPRTDEAYNAGQLLKNLMHFLDKKVLYAWVDEVVDDRAWYIASILPKDVAKGSVTRDFLIRYGLRKDVRDNLHARFGTDSWVGPESQHYHDKIVRFEAIRSSENNKVVLMWLDEHLKILTKYRKAAQIEEERRGY